MMNFRTMFSGRIIFGILVPEIFIAAMADDLWKETLPVFGDNGTFTCDHFCYTPSYNKSDYYPPAFPDPCIPRDPLTIYFTPRKETSVQVFWTVPLATDKNGDIPRIEQVIGETNGSYFNGSAGGRRYDIVYHVIDEDGLRDSCHFSFKVYETCSIGNFFNFTLNKCQKCPVGSYKDNDGIANCTSCPEGTSTTYIGRVSIIDCKEYCRPGSVSTTGLESCVVCSHGYYQDKYGQTGCKKCPNGTTTVLANASSIKDCIVMLENLKCISSSCNGHGCLNKGENISCVCSNGWSGKSCEQPPDTCADNICMNDETCISLKGSYVCKCRENYKGVFCEVIRVNGEWTVWSGWSECSVTCDQGIRQRSRACKNPSPSEYGEDCLGPIYENKTCVMNECQVCPNLNDTKYSSFECTDDLKWGLKTCIVRCKDGFVSIPGFEEFQELRCGLPTGWYWLPVNVTAPCAEKTTPRSLQLASSIEYIEQIPDTYYGMVKTYVLGKLSPTDCFKYANCQGDILLEVSQSKNANEISDRTMLKLFIKKNIALDGNVRQQGFNETENALRDMEITAAYLKNNYTEIFDVHLNDIVHNADERSLKITGKVVCEPGHVASRGSCTRCPEGMYALHERCHYCNKGTFQSKAGQTTCIPCSLGFTTETIGASSIYSCEKKVQVFQVFVDSEDSPMEEFGIISGAVFGALSFFAGIVAFIIKVILRDKARENIRNRFEDLLPCLKENRGNKERSNHKDDNKSQAGQPMIPKSSGVTQDEENNDSKNLKDGTNDSESMNTSIEEGEGTQGGIEGTNSKDTHL